MVSLHVLTETVNYNKMEVTEYSDVLGFFSSIKLNIHKGVLSLDFSVIAQYYFQYLSNFVVYKVQIFSGVRKITSKNTLFC